MLVFAWSCCVLALVPAALMVMNLKLLRAPRKARSAPRLVSVLIPARNEAHNIAEALESVIADRETELEILVLDDHSSDGTADIVRAIAETDARVRLISGRSLPPGWHGKTFACQQLADAARGEVLIFMDADVRLASDAVGRLAASRCPLLSGLPLQVTGTLGEKLVVPLMHFVLYGYLPTFLMRRLLTPSLGAACGQLIVVERSAYESAGGHAAIRGRAHDGVALARRFRATGHLTDLADFTAVARCRMYRSWREVIDGFAKNAHEGLGSPRGILPWTAILLLGQTVPIGLLLFAWTVPGVLWPALIAVMLSYGSRWLAARRFRHDTLSVALHPIAVAVLTGIQWYAIARRVARRPVKWKERRLPAA